MFKKADIFYAISYSKYTKNNKPIALQLMSLLKFTLQDLEGN